MVYFLKIRFSVIPAKPVLNLIQEAGIQYMEPLWIAGQARNDEINKWNCYNSGIE